MADSTCSLVICIRVRLETAVQNVDMELLGHIGSSNFFLIIMQLVVYTCICIYSGEKSLYVTEIGEEEEMYLASDCLDTSKH